MAGNNVSIDNVFTVSVATAQQGLGRYNTSNLALFTEEPYNSGSFGSDGFKIYLSPTDVATDFGTDSKTYRMALGLFSQQPNILLGGGYLAVIPVTTAVQAFALSGIPASGSFTLAFGSPWGTTAAIAWNDTATQIQTKVRALPGFEDAVVTGSLASQSLSIAFKGVYGPVTLATVGGSGLSTSAPVAITITPSSTTAGETLGAAITRTLELVQYFGIMASLEVGQTDMLAAAAVVQAVNKILFIVSSDSASIDDGGYLDRITTGGLTHTRGLYYSDDTDDAQLIFMASYAGLGLSTNFSGSNTTQTMHLKTLNGVQPDPTMNQTILTKAQDAGADVYISIQGVPKVFISGENSFFDRIYNLLAFVGDLQVAGFNVLAQTNTKIPQTEGGMDQLKSAERQVCEKYVNNQYLAPGSWTSPTTFGNQSDFYQNIQQRGYYIYSGPVSQQDPTDRAARVAPLIQIAAKEAGAIHKGVVIVYINP